MERPAFQANAFQNNAFQTRYYDDAIATSGIGGGPSIYMHWPREHRPVSQQRKTRKRARKLKAELKAKMPQMPTAAQARMKRVIGAYATPGGIDIYALYQNPVAMKIILGILAANLQIPIVDMGFDELEAIVVMLLMEEM